MNLIPTQQTTLRNWLATNTSGLSDQAAANALNATASPDYWVWRTSVSQLEIVSVTTGDGTIWNWTAFIARSQGERDGWREMFADGGIINPSLANVRQGLADIFSGSANSAPAQRTHLLTAGRRRVTVFEGLFTVAVSGAPPGNDGVAANRGKTTNPDLLTIEGIVDAQTIAENRP